MFRDKVVRKAGNDLWNIAALDFAHFIPASEFIQYVYEADLYPRMRSLRYHVFEARKQYDVADVGDLSMDQFFVFCVLKHLLRKTWRMPDRVFSCWIGDGHRRLVISIGNYKTWSYEINIDFKRFVECRYKNEYWLGL